MSTYTLRVSGDPLGAAATALGVTDGVRTCESGDDGLLLVVDAPTLDAARSLVEAALPESGMYAISRPPALEDDPDD